MKKALQRAKDATLRLKGYAGWLLTEPVFLSECGRLAEQWRALPAEQRPSLPLVRAVPFPDVPPGAGPAAPAVADFADQIRKFLDRWGLIRMTTWELPDPQGPLLPNPLPPGSPALPLHGVHLVLPLHYPLQGDDELLRQVLEMQRQSARTLGLDDSLAGLPHYKANAAMFDVIHLERVIRARCRPPYPRGLVSRIEEAVAAELGSSLARVRKLRKAISACRQGRRASMQWLRPRNR
jgi:hypothetical protein